MWKFSHVVRNRIKDDMRESFYNNLSCFFFLPVAPASVELKGSHEARAGEKLTYECTTSNSNPPATIQWVVDNVTHASIHSWTSMSPLGGWITHSNVSVRVESSDRNKIVTCNVINSELNAVKTESAILTVICKCLA